MRKFLDQKFWSHGTDLGSLGPLSQQDTILGAGQLQILVIWGPCEPTVVVGPETHAENPKTAGLQCEGCSWLSTYRRGMQILFGMDEAIYALWLTTRPRDASWADKIGFKSDI